MTCPSAYSLQFQHPQSPHNFIYQTLFHIKTRARVRLVARAARAKVRPRFFPSAGVNYLSPPLLGMETLKVPANEENVSCIIAFTVRKRGNIY